MDKLLDALKRELARRQQSNSQYSIRAYSRDLEVDQSTLTRILNGERGISLSIRIKLEQKLGLGKT